MSTVSSRVVAEIHRGIDFPIGWADRPDVIGRGMARDLLVSVAAMFDAELNPLALCWTAPGREERFVHARPDGSDSDSLPDQLHRDLADESGRIGTDDLLATMLWTPDEIRPDQGKTVHRIIFSRGRTGGTSGWNVASRSLVAASGNLLFMTHRIDENLVLPIPTSIEAMHRNLGDGEPRILIVLPGAIPRVEEADVGRKVALLLGGLLLASVLVGAYVANQG